MPSRRRLASISVKIAFRDRPAPFGPGRIRPDYLGRDHHLVAPGKIADCPAEDLFAGAVGIALAVSKKLIPTRGPV